MASGSVALSGSKNAADPEVKVGSIVLMGGTIEQTLAARLQPSPEVPYMQLHVKPPIVIESTSPAANTARLRWSTGDAHATGRARTVAVRGRGRGEGGGHDGARGADRRVVGVGSAHGVSIQNTDGRRLGASFGVDWDGIKDRRRVCRDAGSAQNGRLAVRKCCDRERPRRAVIGAARSQHERTCNRRAKTSGANTDSEAEDGAARLCRRNRRMRCRRARQGRSVGDLTIRCRGGHRACNRRTHGRWTEQAMPTHGRARWPRVGAAKNESTA
jgi:hypothetical protein